MILDIGFSIGSFFGFIGEKKLFMGVNDIINPHEILNKHVFGWKLLQRREFFEKLRALLIFFEIRIENE